MTAKAQRSTSELIKQQRLVEEIKSKIRDTADIIEMQELMIALKRAESEVDDLKHTFHI